jgi:hypothetical protein
MTLAEFKPQDTTGEAYEDMFFRSYITGPQGARYELFHQKHHTNEDVEKAKRYLKRNFDVVSISVIKETK